MRKLILQMGVSLDGLVARPGRHGAGGWGLPPEDPALKERKLDWLRNAGLHVMEQGTQTHPPPTASSRPPGGAHPSVSTAGSRVRTSTPSASPSRPRRCSEQRSRSVPRSARRSATGRR
jgi:hypothetical protein